MQDARETMTEDAVCYLLGNYAPEELVLIAKVALESIIDTEAIEVITNFVNTDAAIAAEILADMEGGL